MEKIDKILKIFNEECNDLLHPTREIPIVSYDEKDPDWCLNFYRDFVASNKPVRIKNGFNSLALKKWNCEYLGNVLGDKKITVSITPNGYADGLASKESLEKINHFQFSSIKGIASDDASLFILPDDVEMPFNEFIDNMKSPKNDYICYIQKQNSNLLEEFPELCKDIPSDIPWVHRLFNKMPDAVNFWMGDCRAISSLHKDFYENMYCVIDGYKDFILIPPTDVSRLTYKHFKVAKFRNVSQSCFEIEMLKDGEGRINEVPWLIDDPMRDNHVTNSCKPNIYQTRLMKGEILYLPSLWFHQVSQSHACIAVNYWYDMDFDSKYCYYKLLEGLCQNINK